MIRSLASQPRHQDGVVEYVSSEEGAGICLLCLAFSCPICGQWIEPLEHMSTFFTPPSWPNETPVISLAMSEIYCFKLVAPSGIYLIKW